MAYSTLLTYTQWWSYIQFL